VKTRKYLVAAVSAAIFLAGCEGDDGADGTNGANGADGFNSLVAFRDLPVGDAVCLGGGLVLDSGLDTNRNDMLDSSEVQATEYFECAATPVLRALHASPDAPLVNIWIDGAPALTDVDFNQGSGFVGVGQAMNVTENGADVNVQVEAILPGGNGVVLDTTLPLEFGSETTVIASGSIEAATFGPILITNEAGEPIADGSFRAQVVHAAPSAPPVDVYVTALDGELVNPVNGGDPLAFGEFTGRLEVPAGDYQIRIAVPGAPPTVVYDSGEIPLAAGADLMIVATENVFLGDSAVQLMVLDGVSATPLYDASTGAAALAVHLSPPNTPAVDILADVGSTAEVEMIKLVDNLAYTEACVIAPVGAPEDYTLSVVATGDTTSVLDIPYTANVNEGTAVIVSGRLEDASLQAIPLGVDGRRVWTEAQLRITHGSPSTPNVDIYLLTDGVLPGDEGVVPAFSDVPFGADTGVLRIEPGVTYDAYVTATGSTVPAISLTDFTPANGQVLEVIARDAFGAEMAPQALIIDYDAIDNCSGPS